MEITPMLFQAAMVFLIVLSVSVLIAHAIDRTFQFSIGGLLSIGARAPARNQRWLIPAPCTAAKGMYLVGARKQELPGATLLGTLWM